MHKTFYALPAAILLACAPLCAGGPAAEIPQLTPEQEQERNAFRAKFASWCTGVPVKEVAALMEHDRRTGDARYASPTHRLTMLHLAALERDEARVRALLAAGADPNALTLYPGRDGSLATRHTPLALVLDKGQSFGPYDEKDPRPIVSALLDAGADARVRGTLGRSLLQGCVQGKRRMPHYESETEWGEDEAAWAEWRAFVQRHSQKWEELAISLMQAGAQGSVDDAVAFIDVGWPRALGYLLESQQGAALRAEPELLRAIAEHFSDRAELSASPLTPSRRELLECARVLRPSAELLNAPLTEFYGTPALQHVLKRTLLILRDPATATPAPEFTDFVALLLELGADAYKRCPEALAKGNESCAADHIARFPALRAELAKRGHELRHPQPTTEQR